MVDKWFMAMSHTSQYMYPDGMFFMDDPVTWDIVVDFLFIFYGWINYYKGNKALTIVPCEYQYRTPKMISFSSMYL